jgi:hypothetical protein
LTEERLTPNRLAVWRLEAPRLTASTIFRLRSSEYAFMLSYDPMWVKVFAQYCRVETGVGIFGQQAIPTAVTLLVFWPVLVAQVWNMAQEAKLDEEAIGRCRRV